MYGCGVIRRFSAKHALAGDFGSESRPHFHNYKAEISIKGPALNEDGFLLNLAELEKKAGEVVTFLLSFSSLNEAPGIKGKKSQRREFGDLYSGKHRPKARPGATRQPGSNSVGK